MTKRKVIQNEVKAVIQPESQEVKANMTVESVNREKLAGMLFSDLNVIGNQSANPWSAADIDKMEFSLKDYQKTIKACRFFYQKDPIVASTINKLVEIGINDLNLSKNGLTENEFRIFVAIKEQLKEFAEIMAMEYLISGLVVPEIRYARVDQNKIKSLGIKKYSTLTLPVTMFIHNPEDITIKESPLWDQPSYYMKVDADIIQFIKSGGMYDNGQADTDLWAKLLAYFPDFVRDVKAGKTEFLIDNPELIIRRKVQPTCAYPVPYLSPALESLKHKRNLRRMDYSIASRVIGAIQLFRLGSDEYPVLAEDQEEQFGSIKSQMLWRDGTNRDVERIFQLFANHTLDIKWVVPDTAALLNEQKYTSVNQDIIYALGFPQILITGEASRTGTSDPQYAMMSPARTMENFRAKILSVIRNIVTEIADQNKLKSAPEVSFKPLTLFDHQTLLKSLADLYGGKNISRHTYAKELGYDWDDETDYMQEEEKVLEEKKLGQFAPLPNGANPNDPNANPNDPNSKNPANPAKKTTDTQTTTPKSDINNTSNNKNGAN